MNAPTESMNPEPGSHPLAAAARSRRAMPVRRSLTIGAASMEPRLGGASPSAPSSSNDRRWIGRCALAFAATLVSTAASAQDEEPPAMEAAPTMEATAIEVAPTTEAPSAAELTDRRQRIRAVREAREAAATEAIETTEAPEAPPLAPTAGEALQGTSEEELEAMAAEENLEGEDFANEAPLDPGEEDADLLAAIEATELAEAHEEVHGEGHGGHVSFGAIVSDRGWQASAITFACLLLLFYLLLFRKGKAVPRALEARRREIEEHLAEAQRLKAEAEAKQAEYAERLEALDSQLETLRAEMVRAGEAERDRIVAEAESKAAAIRKEVEFTIQQRMKQLREDLTAEVARAAVSAAEGILREQTKPADQQRLATEYLKDLAAAAGVKETQA